MLWRQLRRMPEVAVVLELGCDALNPGVQLTTLQPTEFL